MSTSIADECKSEIGFETEGCNQTGIHGETGSTPFSQASSSQLHALSLHKEVLAWLFFKPLTNCLTKRLTEKLAAPRQSVSDP